MKSNILQILIILLLSKKMQFQTLDIENLDFGASPEKFQKDCNCKVINETCNQKFNGDLDGLQKNTLFNDLLVIHTIKSFLIFENCDFYVPGTILKRLNNVCKWTDDKKIDIYCVNQLIPEVLLICQLDLKFLNKDKIDKIGDNASVGLCPIKNKPIKAESPISLKNNPCVKKFLEISTEVAGRGHFNFSIYDSKFSIHYVTGNNAKVLEYSLEFPDHKTHNIKCEGSDKVKDFCNCFVNDHESFDVIKIFAALVVGCARGSEAESVILNDLIC